MEQKRPSSYQLLKTQFEQTQKELELLKNAENQKRPKNSTISNQIPFVQTLFRIRTDISTFRNALLRAENIQYPNRLELYRLYKHIMLDPHLSAVMQNRKASILSSEFIITKDGKEIDELSKIFETKWFYDFCNLALDSMYFGFSLIEFGDLVDDEFTSIKLVPREYVKPEFQIVGATTADITGACYLEKPYSDWCLGIGEEMNLGLLAKAAPYCIWKQGAVMAYAEYCEMYGMPIRILKTDVYDEETRAMGENFMRNLGTSAYAVIGKDDVVEFAEAKGGAGVESLYNGLIDKADAQISKLILGGTGMMDEKSYVGSAEVHQENFIMICGQDKFFIQNVMNYQLLPFLINHGFDLKGCKIEMKPEEELNLTEKFAIDSKLLDYYKIPATYFQETYGTPVEDITSQPTDPNAVTIPKEDFVKEHEGLVKTLKETNPEEAKKQNVELEQVKKDKNNPQ